MKGRQNEFPEWAYPLLEQFQRYDDARRVLRSMVGEYLDLRGEDLDKSMESVTAILHAFAETMPPASDPRK